MPGDPKRTVSTSGGHETVEYQFKVEIFVRKVEVDERALRKLIDEQLAKLGTTLKTSR